MIKQEVDMAVHSSTFWTDGTCVLHCGVLGTSLHPGKDGYTLLLIKHGCCAVIADFVSFYFGYKHYNPYFLFAAIYHLNRARLSLSDLVGQSAE